MTNFTASNFIIKPFSDGGLPPQGAMLTSFGPLGNNPDALFKLLVASGIGAGTLDSPLQLFQGLTVLDAEGHVLQSVPAGAFPDGFNPVTLVGQGWVPLPL